MNVKMIEEFNDEEKFAKRVKEYLEEFGINVKVKFALVNTPKGILYSAMLYNQ